MRCFTLEMIPIPENTSRRSSSLVLATSNPLIKIRFVVSSKPSSNQPCCACAFSLLEFLRFTRAAPLTALPPRKVGVVTLIAPPIRVRIKLLVPRPSRSPPPNRSPLAASIVPSSIAAVSIAIVPSIVPSIAMPSVAIASSIVPSIVPRPVPPPPPPRPRSPRNSSRPPPPPPPNRGAASSLDAVPSHDRPRTVATSLLVTSSSPPRHLLVTSRERMARTVAHPTRV